LSEWQTKMLHAWQLAILRFAVTLDNADRLGVLAIANEIDRLGRQNEQAADFGFFRRSSAELCAAIPQRNERSKAILQQYLGRIDDARLKRAFAAAIEIAQAEPTSVGRRAKPESNLWKGLSSRGSVAQG
jgi:alkyl sulfatase BDS1-like metallo-beta-lactamase superfamily hydrolase